MNHPRRSRPTCMTFVLVALFALPFGCDAAGDGGEEGVEDVGGPGDVGEQTPEADEPAEPLACPWPGPTGTEVGDRLLDIEVKDCDLNPISLTDLVCGQQTTLISVGAGWCQACIEETPLLKAELFEPHEADGLQIIQILTEQASGDPATSVSCRQWVEGLEVPYPVVIDPLFLSEPFFPDDQVVLPLTLLVDGQGVIREKWTGAVPEELVQATTSMLVE